MVSRRHLESATAILTGLFGVAVSVSSLANGIGWSSAGVESGTFPFATGLIIIGASTYNLARSGLLRGSRVQVISRGDLKRSAALFLPAVVLVAAIPLLGMHVASGLYMFGTLVFQNRVPVLRAALASAGVAVCLYVLFDYLFQVSLPVGLLGASFGF
ncbi:MAG TPA: tripartite tricarboxylate transporter TctB family protein [Enterovirga sp.]|jgi:hypothetical protein